MRVWASHGCDPQELKQFGALEWHRLIATWVVPSPSRSTTTLVVQTVVSRTQRVVAFH